MKNMTFLSFIYLGRGIFIFCIGVPLSTFGHGFVFAYAPAKEIVVMKKMTLHGFIDHLQLQESDKCMPLHTGSADVSLQKEE